MSNWEYCKTQMGKDKITWIEKVGYSLGDFSANLIFQTLMTFLAFFYTDVYHIPAGSASAIIFTGGMIGAFFNPIMGMIADRTSTRWGKYRPWILWTALPFGVMAILAFSTPDFSPNGKIAYAFITYMLLVIAYSANNLPYSSLSGVMTGNMSERNSISSYRFTAVTIAQFIVQGLLLPMVSALGNGDKTKGFESIMFIFAIVGVLFFIITFLTTKERVIPYPEQKSSIKQDLKDLSKNKPWIVLLVMILFIFITLSLKGGMSVYYFNNFLDENELKSFVDQLGFNQFMQHLNIMLVNMGLRGFEQSTDTVATAFGLFNTGGIITALIGIALSKKLADKFGKRNVFGTSLFIAALCLSGFFFYSSSDIFWVYLTQLIHGFFYGITTPLLWAMIADVADYSEWKNNRRATGIVFSAMIFGLKAGLSIGGALVAGILAIFGYNNQFSVQYPATISGIKLAVSILPMLTFFASVACLFYYEIDKNKENQIQEELEIRRKNNNHNKHQLL